MSETGPERATSRGHVRFRLRPAARTTPFRVSSSSSMAGGRSSRKLHSGTERRANPKSADNTKPVLSHGAPRPSLFPPCHSSSPCHSADNAPPISGRSCQSASEQSNHRPGRAASLGHRRPTRSRVWSRFETGRSAETNPSRLQRPMATGMHLERIGHGGRARQGEVPDPTSPGRSCPWSRRRVVSSGTRGPDGREAGEWSC